MVLNVVGCRRGFEFQGPRYRYLGDNSGEEFMEEFLLPWIGSIPDGAKAIVDFSGTKGFMSSFLDEAFGGAVRRGYGKTVSRLGFRGVDAETLRDLKQYISNALKEDSSNLQSS
jgi:hypothetical protein